jgi:hypothetical protein
MDSEDGFNLNELIDSSSSRDEDNFYFDSTNIIAEESLTEPLHDSDLHIYIAEHALLCV